MRVDEELQPICLAESNYGTYTMPVNSKKFIHVLLIVVLCYGQLVATIHVVSHIHAHESELTGNSVLDDSSAASPGVADTILAANLHDSSSRVDDNNETEKDCAIYHALLSLSGVFCVVPYELDIPLQLSVKSTYTSNHIARAILDHQHIRAPPTTS